ncbi:MAG: hypothetical protein ACJ764_04555 [Solirubrobacteraceae bacterium]
MSLGLGSPGVRGRGSAAYSLSVVGDAAKVRPSDHPSGPGAATLVAARNETRAFQTVVGARAARLSGLRVTVARPLVGPRGRRLGASSLSIYRESYIKLSRRSDPEGGMGRWPDALIPTVDRYFGERRHAFPVDVPAGKTQTVWVDVFVPAGSPVGRYTGALRVTAAGVSALVPIRLTVIRFTLPATSSLQSAFGMDWDTPCLAAYRNNCIRHERDGWRLKALYVRAALDDRLTISYPQYQPINDSGERRYFERYDLPMLQGTAPTLLRGARLTSLQVDSGEFLHGWRREAQRNGFASHAFLYACDEPNTDPSAWRYCKHQISAAHAVWPRLSALITANIRSADRFGARSAIDWLVPIVNELDDKPHASSFSGNQRPAYDGFLAQSPRKRLWFYTSCEGDGCTGDSTTDHYFTGWPGYSIDEPASEGLAMGWLAFEYRITGELYYAVDISLSHAWTNQYAFGNNGDGNLFYAGNPSVIGGHDPIPIESMRLKLIRDGLQDYEYLRFLATHGRARRAHEVARNLFAAMYRTAVSDGRLQSARAQLQGLVEKIAES